jgi:hypothetical protein
LVVFRRDIMKTKTKLVSAVVLIATQTGCASLMGENMFVGQDEGRLLLSADAEGLRAWNDGVVGLVTEARNNPEQKSSYWQNRSEQNTVKMLRFKKRGTK